MKFFVVFVVFFSQFLLAQNRSHDVFFETDKYIISDSEKLKLKGFIESQDISTISSISIYGYCDDRGSISYNKILSQNRANTVKSFLVYNQLDNEKIVSSSGKGEVELNIQNKSEIDAYRSKNRRVNISISYTNDRSSLKGKGETSKTGNKILIIKGPPNENIDKLNEDFKVGDKIRFENLYFEIGYSFLIPESKKELEKIAEILAKRENIFFTIEGHVCCTSDTRDAIDNTTKKRNLSVARAKYVYDFLSEKGIKKYRMKYAGMERKYPLGGDPKYDRRVEFLITYVGKE